MSTMSATELLSEMGAELGIPALRADEQGCCRLKFDGARTVEIFHVPAQRRWLLTSTLQVSAVGSEDWQLLLRGNWAGAGFGGGWAGLDDQNRVVLHLPLADGDASSSALLMATELLLDHAERWEKRLSQTHSTAARPQTPMALWAQRI